MIRAIIFDLGGVIVRTEDPKPRTQLAHRLGLSRLELEEIVYTGKTGMQAQRGEITIEQHWEHVRQVLGVAAGEMDEFLNQFWEGDRLDIHLVDWLRAQRRVYQTALLSNAFSNLRDYLTRDWKIDDAFDHLIISAEIGITKPDPRIFHLTVEKLNVQPQEVVFVDDFIENIHAARRVGYRAVHFQGPENALSEVNEILQSS